LNGALNVMNKGNVIVKSNDEEALPSNTISIRGTQ
jgi:hypothetical protein